MLMAASGTPIPDPLEGELKEQPPSDLSDYTWDDSETERYEPGRDGTSAPAAAAGGPYVRPGIIEDIGRFQELLISTGLVPQSELLAVRSRLFPAEQPDDLRRLSAELVRLGKLTPYQAAAVRQGKTRGLVIGEYHILDKIGSGGMGLVLRARDRRNGRIVALKLLPPSISRDRAAVVRFRREAAAVAKLRHRNIVAALDSGETHGLLYLVMELVDGKDLARMVKQQGPLAVKQAVDCLIQAAGGLKEAHQRGIIHRDIKPANLLLDRSGTIKILDLGLARVNQANDVLTADSSELNLTTSGAIVGTVDYMSPEQAFDPRLADPRSDIYSLGCTFHYMLTGKAPYGGQGFMERLLGHRERPVPSLRKTRDDVPEALDDLFRRLLAKSPEARPQTMADVIEEFQECRSGAGSKPKARRPAARSRWDDEDEEPGGVYEVADAPPPTVQPLASAPSTVYVRSRGASSDRFEGVRSKRARRRRRLIAALLLFAAVAAGWYFGVRNGWLRLR
jgi:serine/threonine protein kinase